MPIPPDELDDLLRASMLTDSLRWRNRPGAPDAGAGPERDPEEIEEGSDLAPGDGRPGEPPEHPPAA